MKIEFFNNECFTDANLLKCDYDSALFTISDDNNYDEVYATLKNSLSISEITFIDDLTNEPSDSVCGYGTILKIEIVPEEYVYIIELGRTTIRQQLLALQTETNLLRQEISELQNTIEQISQK